MWFIWFLIGFLVCGGMLFLIAAAYNIGVKEGKKQLEAPDIPPCEKDVK